MERFTGTTAVVTGAASGIGLALSERFAAEGMNVVMAGVNAPALEDAAARLCHGGAAVVARFGRPGRFGSDTRPRPSITGAPSANLLATRERRWSDCLKVLAGPWRCPAARSEADPA